MYICPCKCYTDMQYIQGNYRKQAVLFPKCLDEWVGQDNEVRIIDLFVETIKLEDFKFILKHPFSVIPK